VANVLLQAVVNYQILDCFKDYEAITGYKSRAMFYVDTANYMYDMSHQIRGVGIERELKDFLVCPTPRSKCRKWSNFCTPETDS